MEKGLITQNISNKFEVETNTGIYVCDARGKFKMEDIKPVVGDNVTIDIIDVEKKLGVIEEITTRNNYIKRPKIANLNQLVFVVSAKKPKPDLLMLDKQLAFAEYLKVKPIIVINKIDLDDKIADEIEKEYKNIGYKVIKTFAKEHKGINKLEEELKGKISAFSGNSGVGKSTLLNAIFKDTINNEGEISLKNQKGKNTTTQVGLYKIDKETYIADTPGFSSFEIFEIESNELANYFIEFRQYIKNCEFVGCTHIKEENCGIKKAVEEGKISFGRYNRFEKIYEVLKDREEHKW